ncbi:MAG: DUF6672 family protein [Bullifex sp.]
MNLRKPDRTFWIRFAAIIAVILVAVLMYVIGKQHNVYIDNKDQGSYKAFSFCEVTMDKQDSLQLAKRDRDVFTVVNQGHKLTVEANGQTKTVKLSIPLQMKNILINIPAFMADAPQSEWMSEFIIETVSPAAGDETIVTDDTAAFFE